MEGLWPDKIKKKFPKNFNLKNVANQYNNPLRSYIFVCILAIHTEWTEWGEICLRNP